MFVLLLPINRESHNTAEGRRGEERRGEEEERRGEERRGEEQISLLSSLSEEEEQVVGN